MIFATRISELQKGLSQEDLAEAKSIGLKIENDCGCAPVGAYIKGLERVIAANKTLSRIRRPVTGAVVEGAARVVGALFPQAASLPPSRPAAATMPAASLPPSRPAAASAPPANARAAQLLREYQLLDTTAERSKFARVHRDELRNGPLARTSLLAVILSAKEISGSQHRLAFANTLSILESGKPAKLVSFTSAAVPGTFGKQIAATFKRTLP